MMMVPTIFTKDIKEYCEEVKDKIRTSVREDFINEGAAVPILAVIQVGNNEASNRYIRNKKKDCESVGIKFEWYYYEESITQEQLIEEIKDVEGVNLVFSPAALSKYGISQTIIPQDIKEIFQTDNYKMIIMIFKIKFDFFIEYVFFMY